MACLALLGAACSATYASSGDSSGSSQPDLLATLDAIVADTIELQVAKEPLVVECMAKLGYVYTPGDPRNGADLGPERLEQYSAALNGSKRIEFTGLFGLSGSHAADGCEADARSAIAGGLQPFVDPATARHDVETLVALVNQEAERTGDLDAALASDVVRENLPDIIERWQEARSHGLAALVDG